MKNLEEIKEDLIKILPIVKEEMSRDYEENDETLIFDIMDELDYDDSWTTEEFTEFTEYDSPFRISIHSPFVSLEDVTIEYNYENVNDRAKDTSITKWLHIEGISDIDYKMRMHRLMFRDVYTMFPNRCECRMIDADALEKRKEVGKSFKGGYKEKEPYVIYGCNDFCK